jgi:hypothetical protein
MAISSYSPASLRVKDTASVGSGQSGRSKDFFNILSQLAFVIRRRLPQMGQKGDSLQAHRERLLLGV